MIRYKANASNIIDAILNYQNIVGKRFNPLHFFQSAQKGKGEYQKKRFYSYIKLFALSNIVIILLFSFKENKTV